MKYFSKWSQAKVFHSRISPKKNAFRYRVNYLGLDVDHLPSLNEYHFISYNRFNIFSLRDQDHGYRHNSKSISSWVQDVLSQYSLVPHIAKVILVTCPKVLFYVFNPVSFYYCLSDKEELIAVISEVNNTFGEHHSYISFHDDFRAILPDDILKSHKIFHVSPFMPVTGEYYFRFSINKTKFMAIIDYYIDDQLMLLTSLQGDFVDITTRNTWAVFVNQPLLSIAVMFKIHYQALKLWFKSVKFYRKPKQNKDKISR